MATYSKETALYETGAIAHDINEARNTAEKYVTDVSSNGMFVHTEDSPTPRNPSEFGNYGVHIHNSVDIINNGNKVASYGEVAIIGRKDDSKAYIEIGNYQEDNKPYLTVNDNAQTPIFECVGDISKRTVYTEQSVQRQFDTATQTVQIEDGILSEGDIIITVKIQGNVSVWEKHFTEGTSGWQFYEAGFTLRYTASTNVISLEPSGSTLCRFDKLFYEIEEPAPTLYFGNGNYASNGDTALLGYGLEARGEGQTIVGRFNKPDSDGKYAFIVGNGNPQPPSMSTTDLSNAFAVEWTGNVVTGKDFDSTNLSDVFTIPISTDWNYVAAECSRRSHVVQLHIQMTNKSDISVGPSGNITDITVGTLVQGIRPLMLTTAHSHGNYAGQQWYYISSAGAIALTALEGTGSSRTINAGTRFDVMATYIVE